MARVALCTFGSGGDLFPILAVAQQLAQQGDEVVVATPRALGLYVRSLRVPSLSYGTGHELSFVDDASLFTTRFGGWDSHRQTACRYVARSLAEDVEAVTTFFERWQPDVVVSMTYGTPGRLAALALEIPHVSLSIYPDHQRLLRGGRRFAGPYLASIRAACPPRVWSNHAPEHLGWGVEPNPLLLHDPVLLGDSVDGADATLLGYPYLDGLPVEAEVSEDASEWVRSSSDPVVVVTLGSFIGAAVDALWHAGRAVADHLGMRVLIVNGRAGAQPADLVSDDRVKSVGFVPLSALLPDATAIVHHGGVGTTYAAIAAACPSVVVPQAFDQVYTAGLVEAAGLGRRASGATLVEALRSVLDDADLHAGVQAAAAGIGTTEAATASIAAVVLGGRTEPSGVQVGVGR